MSSIRIEQYAGAGRDERAAVQVPLLPMLAPAEIVSSSASSTRSGLLNPATRLVLIKAIGGEVAVTIGINAVAATTDALVSVNESRWFGVDSSQAEKMTIAVIDVV